jgi:hypothetical protein
VLDAVREAALAEQTTDFDPSGSSGDAGPIGSDETGITETDWTSTTGELVSEATDESLESGCFKESEHFDTATKEALLAETFPTLRYDFVVRILKKCDDNLSKATDELLNHVYLNAAESSPTEELDVPKGIDAFSEEYHVPTRKRGKGKKKRNGSHQAARATSVSECGASSSPSNPWRNGKQIDFIVSRTNMPRATVSSLYHKNGASLPATIMALRDKDLAANNAREPDAALVEDAIALSSEYPNVPLEHSVALLRLASLSNSHARELAEAMLNEPELAKTREVPDLVPRYAPLRLSDPSNDSTELPYLPPSARPQTTASLAAARSHAFNQASAAYRKGKSNPLMKAAAGYYAQVGRDVNANLKAMTQADADALVASQSSSTCLDLHGVSVESATRIAKAKTKAWWDGLGEARIPGGGRSGVGEGFRIITGLGNHSEGGRGKIGPAVAKTLVKEGWKVEVAPGELVVMGLARKR